MLSDMINGVINATKSDKIPHKIQKTPATRDWRNHIFESPLKLIDPIIESKVDAHVVKCFGDGLE